MAAFGPWKAAFLTIDGTSLASLLKSATLDYGANAVDITANQDLTQINAGGILNWSLVLEFNQDFSASGVHDTLFAGVGTTMALVLRPTTAAVGATNRNLSGTGILESYTAWDGSHGDNLVAKASFVSAGTLTSSTS